MNEDNKIDLLLGKLKQNEQEIKQALEQSIEKKQLQFQYKITQGKVNFENTIKKLHQQKKTGVLQYLMHTDISTFLTAPVIYSMIFPLAFLDLTISIYQQICFRIYQIPIVKRTEYIVIDRQYLSYLNVIEKLNCVYCGYGNGVAAYALEVIARTEQYWCPIKHAKKHLFQHARSEKFIDYGDVEAYKKQLEVLRKQWSDQ